MSDDVTESVSEAAPRGKGRTAGFAGPTSGVKEYARQRWDSVKAGELGSNVLLQMAPIAFLAIGIIFVLLIADGEVVTIDLSVAFVAATCGTVLVLLQRPDDPGWPWWAAILAALVLGTAIGLLHALIITKLGVPSFVTFVPLC